MSENDIQVKLPLEFLIPAIEPVSLPIGLRPFWSVMIPTFERVEYLEKTLHSVLEQDPGPQVMQIEVVDNCSSTAAIKELVERIGSGRVSLFRQERNVGMVGNWNTCIQRAHGLWIHILHDDDAVLPGFYRAIQDGIRVNEAIGAAFTRYNFMDEWGATYASPDSERDSAGILENWLERIVTSQRIQCSSIVVKRSTYELLGGFSEALIHATDWEMWRRIAVWYPVWYDPSILALYRVHPNSLTACRVQTGEDLADIRKSILMVQQFLRHPQSSAYTKRALCNYADYGYQSAKNLLLRRQHKAAFKQILQSLLCDCSIGSLLKIARLIKYL